MRQIAAVPPFYLGGTAPHRAYGLYLRACNLKYRYGL
jgi:hypothetical protein